MALSGLARYTDRVAGGAEAVIGIAQRPVVVGGTLACPDDSELADEILEVYRAERALSSSPQRRLVEVYQ
jgi:hypothetical protein